VIDCFRFGHICRVYPLQKWARHFHLPSSRDFKQGCHSPYIVLTLDSITFSRKHLLEVFGLCGLVVRVPGYRFRGPGFNFRTLQGKKSSGSGTGSTQPREYNWPPLWSSGQSSWLQIRRSRVRFPGSTRKKKGVGLERGPLSLVSTTEELLGSNSSGSGLESQEYGRRDSPRWSRSTLYPKKSWH
jgi:hypothetical protein